MSKETENSKKAKAQWAAREITNPDQKTLVQIISADTVLVHILDPLDGQTIVATTTTTEPRLLQALLRHHGVSQ